MKSSLDGGHNSKLRNYLDALGETEPSRLPHLPSAFSLSDKSPHIIVKEPYFTQVEYKGPGTEDNDAAQVRTNYAIPSECGIYYFEVRVLSRGKEGFVGVGVSTKDVRVCKLPGWDKGSFGYHGDDGKKFRGCGAGEPYGPTYSMGDVIGCLVNFLDSTIGYTKNGLFLGVAFADVKERELFPIVGMRSEGECLELNCGADPFVFDLHTHIREERSRVQRMIHDVPVQDISGAACQSILAFLIHQGHPSTALVFARNCGHLNQFEPLLDQIRQRRAALDAVLLGDIPFALALLGELAPTLLEERPDLLFMLRCQQFIEMVKAGCDVAEILAYGSDELYSLYDGDDTGDHADELSPGQPAVTEPLGEPHRVIALEDVEEMGGGEVDSDGDEVEEDEEDGTGEEPEGPKDQPRLCAWLAQMNGGENAGDRAQGLGKPREMPPYVRQRLLERVFSLLAYTEPETSPHAFLLDPVMRVVLAERLNAALQATSFWARRPTLDRLARQARVTLDQLGDHSAVGLLLKDSLPLGYGEGNGLQGAKQLAAQFYDPLES